MKTLALLAVASALLTPALTVPAQAKYICDLGAGGVPIYCQGNPPGWVPPPPPKDRRPMPTVCFFTGTGYTGRSFCRTGASVSYHVRAPWRDAIRSIKITGRAQVRACPGNVLQGSCTTFSSSIRRLQSDLFDSIHSFSITASR